eukprot:256682-Rhodomonas_salina.1
MGCAVPTRAMLLPCTEIPYAATGLAGHGLFGRGTPPMLLCSYAPMLLCSYAPMLLWSYTPMLLWSYTPMLLWSCTPMLLCAIVLWYYALYSYGPMRCPLWSYALVRSGAMVLCYDC